MNIADRTQSEPHKPMLHITLATQARPNDDVQFQHIGCSIISLAKPGLQETTWPLWIANEVLEP